MRRTKMTSDRWWATVAVHQSEMEDCIDQMCQILRDKKKFTEFVIIDSIAHTPNSEDDQKDEDDN